MPKLNVKKIQALKKPGMHGDGDGLYLNVSSTGSKSWILRTMLHGKRREFGLGSLSAVSPAEAREKAREMKKKARQGIDPRNSLKKRGTPTFAEVANEVLEVRKAGWRSEGHAERWIASLEAYAFPYFGDHPVDAIVSGEVLKAIVPIWTEKHDTAKRVLQRISVVFDWARSNNYSSNANPVDMARPSLPAVKREVRHMPALPWRQLPEFMNELSEREAVSARALEFLILTCGRSKEVRGARWSEFEGDTWIVPAERMKAGKEHRVPLNSRALQVLELLKGLDSELVFPSRDAGRMMSDTVFKALTDRMGRTGFTSHGFRSTFRDWASESAKADPIVAEHCLAHSFGNTVQRAYARSDLLERRRSLMDAWGNFATGQTGNVVEMVRA